MASHANPENNIAAILADSTPPIAAATQRTSNTFQKICSRFPPGT
jgi:hypothetical protein